MKNNFYGKNFVSVSSLTKEDIALVFSTARNMKNPSNVLQGKIMTALFYEPSSRTYGSFISAMQRLGGGFIPIQGVAYSSVSKGETLEDTVATFARLSDIIVLRHPDEGAAGIAANVSTVPVINAGDGTGEHPTQALLDLYTIQSHFQDISNLMITFAGDLKNGRTVHSLRALLSMYKPKKIHYISPPELTLPDAHGSLDLEAVLSETDVLYVTRVQKERFSDAAEYERLKNVFCITAGTMKKLKKSAILMHPFPRVGEIVPPVDTDARAVYLREQISNGLYVRMALLSLILNK